MTAAPDQLEEPDRALELIGQARTVLQEAKAIADGLVEELDRDEAEDVEKIQLPR